MFAATGPLLPLIRQNSMRPRFQPVTLTAGQTLPVKIRCVCTPGGLNCRGDLRAAGMI